MKSFLGKIINSVEVFEGDNVTINTNHTLSMTNTYNGKTFTNTDNINQEVYNQLDDYLKEKDYISIEKLLKGKKINAKLISNKYIDSKTIKTLVLKKQEFRNFSISHA